MKIEEINDCCDDCKKPIITEGQYQGKTVELNSPFRTPQGPRKFAVYVMNSNDKVVKVCFGDPNATIKNYDPEKAKSFQARHKCSEKTDKTTPGWWSCNVHRYAKQLGLSSTRPW